MRYIRRKDDPLKVIASGEVGLGGLGAFDTDIYEEIEGELPEGFIFETPKTLPQRLNDIFNAQAPEVRAQFGPLKASVKIFFDEGDTLAVLATINGAQVSEALQPVKDQMLALFEEGS
jgi:hypothetical protein